MTELEPITETKDVPVRVQTTAEQHDLALAWFATSIIGIVAIALVPDRLGAVRMLTPLAAMAVFVVFGLSRSRFSTPRLADSIYFMGFLWTLWALIDVLVFSEQLRAEQLYNAFGYALIATASGMFIRLALLQFYRTVDDQEEQAVDQVDQAVSRLNTCVDALASELANTQRAVAGLRAQGATMLHEWHKEFAVAARKPVTVLADAATDLDRESQNLAGALKEVRAELTPIAKTIQALDSRLADATTKLSDGMTRNGTILEHSLNQFHANLSKIETSPELLERQIREVATSLQRALTPLDESAAKILKNVDTAIVSLAQAILTLPDDARIKEVAGHLAGELDELCTRSRALTVVVTTASDGFREAGEHATAFAGAVDDSRNQLGQGLTEVTKEAKQLQAAISEAGQDTREVDAALRQVLTFVRGEVARR